MSEWMVCEDDMGHKVHAMKVEARCVLHVEGQKDEIVVPEGDYVVAPASRPRRVMSAEEFEARFTPVEFAPTSAGISNSARE